MSMQTLVAGVVASAAALLALGKAAPEWAWKLVKPASPADFWSMVAAFTNLGVVAVALKGLNALAIAKKDLLTRAQRDSRACAVLRCEEMAQVLIAHNGDLVTKYANLKKPVFVKSPAQVNFETDGHTHLDKAKAWHQDIPPDVFRETVNLLNRMEAWAMYFTTGLADHEVAFGPCGPVFCALVVRYYPTLVLARSSSGGKYPNVVKVFNDWRGKIDERALLDGLEKVQARRRVDELPTPIGLGD